MTTYLLAIDQGTTSSRAIVFRQDLTVAASAQKEFTQHFPASGWVEHEPEDLWSSVVETCAVAPLSVTRAAVAVKFLTTIVGRLYWEVPRSKRSRSVLLDALPSHVRYTWL